MFSDETCKITIIFSVRPHNTSKSKYFTITVFQNCCPVSHALVTILLLNYKSESQSATPKNNLKSERKQNKNMSQCTQNSSSQTAGTEEKNN